MFTQTTEEAFLAVSYLKISHKSRAEDPGVKGLFPFFMCFIFIYLFNFFFNFFFAHNPFKKTSFARIFL